jgi:hypothetical protein
MVLTYSVREGNQQFESHITLNDVEANRIASILLDAVQDKEGHIDPSMKIEITVHLHLDLDIRS